MVIEGQENSMNTDPPAANRALMARAQATFIDQVTALKRGGADACPNMQWQTIDEAKLKNKIKRSDWYAASQVATTGLQRNA